MIVFYDPDMSGSVSKIVIYFDSKEKESDINLKFVYITLNIKVFKEI